MAVANGTAASGPYESHVVLTPENKIDELVLSKLQELKIQPAPVCSDPVFVRRAYLDVIGTLPTALEAENFILDRNPNKRAVLIDRLLERDEFADYWAMKWSDFAAHQGGVPNQFVAQRGTGVSPLDSDVHQGKRALRQIRPRPAYGQRRQFQRATSQFLPRPAEQRSTDHRANRGIDVHGCAGRKVAGGTMDKHGGVFFEYRL